MSFKLLISIFIFTQSIFLIQPFSHEVVFQWKEIDFKFHSENHKQEKIKSLDFIPANNVINEIKLSGDDRRIFLTLPRFLPGVPATLTYVDYNPLVNNTVESPLLIPYPNWSMQQIGNCNCFQTVISMEIDQFNRMWIIDSGRVNILTPSPINKCPPKLVIMDLETNEIIKVHVFPPEVVSRENNILNDIVVGCKILRKNCWAYITNTGEAKIVVYDLRNNKSWSVHHSSMRADPSASIFTYSDKTVNLELAVDGIALSPFDRSFDRIYYSPLSSFNVYSVPTKSIQNQHIVKNGTLELNDSEVILSLTKTSQSDGLIICSNGILFYGLLTKNSINYWNTSHTNTKVLDGEILVQNDTDLFWVDTFAFGHNGYLYATTNRLPRFVDRTLDPIDVNYRVVRIFLGIGSYMYQGTMPKLQSRFDQINLVKVVEYQTVARNCTCD